MTLSTGWHAANFANAKRMKSLEEYLKPPLTKAQQRDKDTNAVAAMLRRRLKRQNDGTV